MQDDRKTPIDKQNQQMEIEEIVSPIHTPDSILIENNPNISIIAEEKLLSDEDLHDLFDTQKEEKNDKQIKRRVHINEEVLRVIRNMNLRGYKAKEIALITDVTKSTVYKYIERLNDVKMKENDDVKQLIKQRGRKKSTNVSLQSKLKGFMESPQQMTLRQMRETLKEEDNLDISISYLSKTIKRMGKSKRLSGSGLNMPSFTAPNENGNNVVSKNNNQQMDLRILDSVSHFSSHADALPPATSNPL